MVVNKEERIKENLKELTTVTFHSLNTKALTLFYVVMTVVENTTI
jgi:hypothetical protein